MTLTILLFEDAEKPKQYLTDYLGAIAHWNRSGLEETQIILITQKKNMDDARAAAAASGILVKIIKSDNPHVAGHPVWDVMKDVRKVWKHIRGDWITFNHTEFIWCRERLKRTIDWLNLRRPYLALGNLRRPGSDKGARPTWRPGNCDRRVSEPLALMMRWGEWLKAWRAAEQMSTLIWPLWRAQDYKFGVCKWSEDTFFADRRWLETWRGTDHGGELPFQDVYDLMGTALGELKLMSLDPMIHRMTEAENRIIHMWHPKGYRSWTPEIRDWFFSEPERWRHTAFLNMGLWERLLKLEGEKDTRDWYAKFDLRRGKQGTVTRYKEGLRRYLDKKGAAELRKFYRKYGVGERVHEYDGKNTGNGRDPDAAGKPGQAAGPQ